MPAVPLVVIEEVRPLAAHDCADVADLEAAARTATASQRGGEAHLQETPAVGDWRPLVDQQRVWVAVLDELVVGFLELATEGTRATVRQVYVRPEARELGFGDALLAAATDAARAAGCTVLEGTALPGDRDTKNLYERAGVVARKIVLSRRL